MLNLHANSRYGCEASGCDEGLKEGQLDLFSTLSE